MNYGMHKLVEYNKNLARFRVIRETHRAMNNEWKTRNDVPDAADSAIRKQLAQAMVATEKAERMMLEQLAQVMDEQGVSA